jgi:D-xylose transport system ATP-binding protein
MSAIDRSASTGTEPLLALHGVSKRFGAVQALSGVDFDVRAGEVVGLVGDNGAGKSTLVKVMSGIYGADEGEYRFEGAVQHVNGASDATALGVATVYQDLALCDNLDVVANLFVGREELSGGVGGVLRSLDEASMEKQAAELLQTLTVRLPSVRQEVGTLSGGQRQSVAIARSLIGEAKVVLLDEPTAALGVAQTEQVLQLIRRLREQGLGVVVISHNLANVFDVVDRIFVMRLGRKAGVYEVGETSQEEIVGAITGAEFGRSNGGGGPAGGGGPGDPGSADPAAGSSFGGGSTEARR